MVHLKRWKTRFGKMITGHGSVINKSWRQGGLKLEWEMVGRWEGEWEMEGETALCCSCQMPCYLSGRPPQQVRWAIAGDDISWHSPGLLWGNKGVLMGPGEAKWFSSVGVLRRTYFHFLSIWFSLSLFLKHWKQTKQDLLEPARHHEWITPNSELIYKRS